MPKRVAFSLDWARFGLLLIAAGTLLNAFVTAVRLQFDPTDPDDGSIVHTTFLGDPQDLHADLIELSLSFPPFVGLPAASWPYPYSKFALENYYHSFDLSHDRPKDVTWWSPPPAVHPGEDWPHGLAVCATDDPYRTAPGRGRRARPALSRLQPGRVEARP